MQKAENLGLMKLRFIILHIGSLGVFFVKFKLSLLWLLIISFSIKAFGFEAGYHRYFAHKSFKTSRIFQFILAFLGASGGYRGPLWWAAYHRFHHRYADTTSDIHSPQYHSFWYTHMGWFFNKIILDTDFKRVKDFAKYPELVLLNKYHYICPILIMISMYFLGEKTTLLGANVNGLQCVIYGFFLSTLLGLHTTFAINSIAHRKTSLGFRRFHTKDMTHNLIFLALPSMGGAWHNNHHRFASSAKAGFYWWEIDLAYYILKILAFFKIVWQLRDVPAHIIAEGQLPRETI